MRLLIHDYAGHPFPVSLSRTLARRGHQVYHAFSANLLTPRGTLENRTDEPMAPEFIEVPMSPLYRANKYSYLKRRGYERDYGRELVRLVARVKPDVILSGQTPSEPQLALIRAARGQSIPTVTWIQDFYSLAVDKLVRRKIPVLGPLIGAWYRRLDRQCFKQSAALIAITEDFIPILSEFQVPAEKITVIPNWASLEELPLRPKKNAWSATMGLEDKFIFLYSGTMAMKHNPELLRRLCLHFENDPDVRIVMISEGPGAEYLARRKEVENLRNLVLLPYQPFQAMPDVLGAADVFLSVLEPDAGVFSVPSKVLTYHAAGRPILGAMPAENLASRIIAKQRSGICVPPDDYAGFLQSASSLRESPSLRVPMGERGRGYAEQEFDLARIASRFERLFHQVSPSKNP